MNTRELEWASSPGIPQESMNWLAGPVLAFALIGPVSTSTATINWEGANSSPQTEVLWSADELPLKPFLSVSSFTAVRHYLNSFKQVPLKAVQEIYDLVVGMFPNASISFENYREAGSPNGLRFIVDLKGSQDPELYQKELNLFEKIEGFQSGYKVLRSSIIDIY